MLKNKIYYNLKPLVPRRLQIAIRSWLVLRKRRKCADVWPIDEAAKRKPEGWAGWPGGKRFALVLTHDVDTAKGHANCDKLMQLEMEMGFKSSFNFVAERYPVSAELREQLTANGFEVGVHGLYHDGKYYESREIFMSRALKINRYLKEWNSVGFRSPAMQCNLDWIHDLNIEYDASTFDTDPFEPEPDGVRTIFPFCKNGDTAGNSYIELPYTLPQDFTLFVLMKGKNIDIWKRKLDWIAKNGGMALLITHPDYMNFGGEKTGHEEYPVEYYKKFLEYIKQKYEGQYWQALPREVVSFWPDDYKNKPRKPAKRICMLAYTFYEVDGRVKRYAEALAQRGDRVDVVSLRREGQAGHGVINGVNVYRIQERVLDEKGKLSYLTKLMRFFIKSSVFISKRNMSNKYDLIHIHSVPDFEVFAAWLPKLLGTKIILDVHDIVPEFYASKFSVKKSSSVFKALILAEKASASFADHVIIANHIWEKTITSRSVKKEKCTTMLNYPDSSLFYKRPRRRPDGKFIMLYPGTLNWHQGLDIAIKAFALIKDQVPGAEFHIYGEGSSKGPLRDLVAGLSLGDRVFIRDVLPIEEIAAIMSDADLGVVPKRNDSFGGEAFSTKIFEFMALGVPVIASGTKIDRYYFNDSLVEFFEPENEKDLAQAMLKMVRDHALRESLARNASRYIKQNSWDERKTDYFNLVDDLVGKA